MGIEKHGRPTIAPDSTGAYAAYSGEATIFYTKTA